MTSPDDQFAELLAIVNREFSTKEDQARLEAAFKPVRDLLDEISRATQPVIDLAAALEESARPVRELFAGVATEIDTAMPLRPAAQSIVLGTAYEQDTAGAVTIPGGAAETRSQALEGSASVAAHVSIETAGVVGNVEKSSDAGELAFWVSTYLVVESLLKNIQDSTLRELVVRNLVVPVILVIVWLSRRAGEQGD